MNFVLYNFYLELYYENISLLFFIIDKQPCRCKCIFAGFRNLHSFHWLLDVIIKVRLTPVELYSGCICL
jgi:hypothetical protein